MANFLADHQDFRDIALINADPSSWDWTGPLRAHWELADNTWQNFAMKWRSIDEQVDMPRFTPRILDLSPAPRVLRCPRILIRDCYVEAEKFVWEWAIPGPDSGGVIFSGQPGIGKSVFLYYLLVRLLQMKQPVLFQPSTPYCILFWHDAVYTGNPVVVAAPNPSNNSPAFLWSLVDPLRNEEPPRLATDTQCFTVQASSPNDIHYKLWRKERTPRFTAFPLWTQEELKLALPLTLQYQRFREYLDKVMSHWADFPSWKSDPKARTYRPAVSLLHEAHKSNPPGSTDEALHILLDILIFHFGPIPRDVFRAMFVLQDIKLLHETALQVEVQQLWQIRWEISAESQSPSTVAPHRVISINPVDEIGEPAYWQINFKSVDIGNQVSERLVKKSEDEVRLAIEQFFLVVPQKKGLAGSLFEPLAHRDIARGNTADPSPWSLKEMRLEGNDSKTPTFVFDASGATIDGFSKIPRTLVKFDYAALPKCFADDEYYVPRAPNHPFFDSFVVNLDPDDWSAHLWLLQVTVSDVHKGSPKGYPAVCKIIERIWESLQQCSAVESPPEKKVKVKVQGQAEKRKGKPRVWVHYLLVRPDCDPDQDPKWVLPEGWNHGTTQIDHRGKGYLLKFPLRP